MDAKHAASWPESDTSIVLDGIAASVLGAAAICDALVFEPDFIRSGDAWPERNRFGRRLSGTAAPSGRDAVAIGTGMALAGERTAVFLSSVGCAAALDLLTEAAGRHAPLVVHVICRALAGPTRPIGTGHEILERIASTGCVVLSALDAQDVLDLSIAAHRTAERALVPVVVAMDAQEIAEAPQDVMLPGVTLLRAVVGEPSAPLSSPTPAQRILLGDVRRAVPRWYDLERPVLLGPVAGEESSPHAAAGHERWFAGPQAEVIESELRAVGAALGRPLDSLVEIGIDGARTVLVASGSLVTTVAALAKFVRGERRKVGILGIRCISPLPTGALAATLTRCRTIGVIERQDVAEGADPPLARGVRHLLAQAAENERHGASSHAGLPAIASKHLPRLVSVRAGLGGAIVRGADLRALVEELARPARSRIRLGASFHPAGRVYPKRTAFLDELRRIEPDLDGTTLCGHGAAPDLRGPGAHTVALLGAGSERFLAPLAAFLHAWRGEHVRARRSAATATSGRFPLHELTIAPQPSCVPVGDGPIDALLVTEARGHGHDLVRLRERGPVMLVDVSATALSLEMRRGLAARGAMVYELEGEASGAALGDEWALGALARSIASDPEAQRESALSAREATLGALSAPERSACLEAFARGWAGTPSVDIGLFEADDPPALPVRLAALRRSDTTIDCLPRFWDQVGVLHRDHETEALTPDPYLAAGAVPALSSVLQDERSVSSRIAFFDPATFDGDVRMWTECAEGGVAPLGVLPRTLIETGMTLAAEDGHSAEALRSAVANLARQVSRVAKSIAGTTAGELLATAFAQLVEKGGAILERRAALEPALEAVVAAIGALPLLRTAALFDEPESERAGTGALLTVVMHPDQLRTANGMIAAWSGRGVRGEARSEESLGRARRLWRIWERLPDTPGALVERARGDERFGPLAGPLLSRHCLLAAARMPAEPGSGAALALRHVLALAEAHLQPRLQTHLDQVGARRHELAERIRGTLADALPVQDLEALSRGLETLGGDEVALSDLSGRVETAVAGAQVDAARVRRLVEVARGLADLDWRIARGPDGLGRARAGLVIAAPRIAAWAAGFPENPFVAPVVTAGTGEGVALARGLLEGHVRRTLHGCRLLRWAALELDGIDAGADAPDVIESLAGLGWPELDADERALCAPLVLVVDEHVLRGAARTSIEWMLRSRLPVKVLLLDGLSGLEDTSDEATSDPAASACLGGRAYVVQTTLGDAAHFGAGVTAALRHDGPALVHVHAPSPGAHGFAVGRTGERSALAVAARVHPLYTFDPARSGVLGARFDLSGNAAPLEPWGSDDGGNTVTVADWAVGEGRFAAHFTPAGPDVRRPTPVAEYLLLDAEGRSGRTPIVQSAERGACCVSAGLVAVADRVATRWRVLQELAGVATPFVERIRAEIEAEGAEARRGQLADLQRQHEAGLAALQARLEVEVTERVTRGLMTLAGYAPEIGPGLPPGAGDGASNATVGAP